MPPRPVRAPTTVDNHSMRPNESVDRRATTAGVTIAAAIRVTPRMRIEAMIAAAITRENATSTTPVRTPNEPATSGSKVTKSSCLYSRRTTAAHAAPTPASTQMSVMVTPRTLPKKAASKFCVKRRFRLIRAMPRAYDAVVTMPMAASAPTRRFRDTPVIISAESAPHRPPVT
jgi:hypothetical protein